MIAATYFNVVQVKLLAAIFAPFTIAVQFYMKMLFEFFFFVIIQMFAMFGFRTSNNSQFRLQTSCQENCSSHAQIAFSDGSLPFELAN